MAIGTGAVSMSDIRTEWGRSGAIKLSEMYRGGSHVRNKAANNTGTNLASGVPESGVITIDDFRGTTAGFRYTYTATATNQDASDLFGDDYAVNYRKEIVINSGVELGATSTSEEALEIDSGGSGTIVVTNNGTLTGAGGAAGADGGDAFEAAVTCTFINNGTVRAGGGGGGAGGGGGGGSYSSTQHQGSMGHYTNDGNCTMGCRSFFGVSSYCYSGCSYPSGLVYCTGCGRSVTTNTNGGSGGGGAVGAGYNQSAGTGSSGSAGGTNAGTGGTGGNGGSFGNAGSTGANGANGNRTNGSSGSAGGAAGKYLRGSSFVTFTNNGTVQGGTA